MVPKGQRPHPRRADRRGVSLEDAADNVASFSNAIKSANALPSDRGVHAAEEAVMRTIPLVLITFVALSLSPTAARAGANGSWCANYGTGLDGSINCSYTSFEQCRATVSGIYGFCTPNPYPGTGYGRGGTWNLTPTSRGRSYRTER
jgi:Protein of unknown function (DUF3551)